MTGRGIMTLKEEYFATIVGHEKTEHVMADMGGRVAFLGGRRETFENGPTDGGLDGFGIKWEGSESASGQPVPSPGSAILHDIEDWEDVVRFPDLDAYDWEEEARIQLANVNRDTQVLDYCSWNAQFLRVTHLMGFMDGLCAFAEEPEICKALVDAISDYKIRILERVQKYFKPDFFTSFDDVATQSSLFLSPETYREIIKPAHKKVNDAAKAMGMYPKMHTCGYCEALIPDFIDEGNVAWTSAQPSNDIEGILKKYGKQIAVIGGYDTNGLPGQETASYEVIENEVRRCLETYAPYGSYSFFGFRIMNSADPMAFFEGLRPIHEAFRKLTQ